MRRTEFLQELRKMRFSEAYEGWQARRLTQSEAASLLGVCNRTFRRYLVRYEESGLEGLIDRRLEQVSHLKAPADEVMALNQQYSHSHLDWNVKHFHAWYRKGGGTRSYTWVKSRSPEARRVMNAMLGAAPDMARLEGAGRYDQRRAVTDAARALVKAVRDGKRTLDYARQLDLDQHPNAKYVLDMISQHFSSERELTQAFREVARKLRAEYDKPEVDLFGETPKRSAQQIFNEAINDDRQADTANAGGVGRTDAPAAQFSRDANADATDMLGANAKPGGISRSESTEQTGRTTRSATGEVNDFKLVGETQQDLHRRNAAHRDDALRQHQQEKAAAQKAAADQARDDFALTGSERTADMAAMRGQMPLFSRPEYAPDAAIRRRIDQVLDAEDRRPVDFGKTPEALVWSGLPELNLRMSARVVDKIHWDHGLTRNQIASLDSALADPLMVLKSD